ncbi:hypothetical protein [uncultured Ruminococcus sp.]|uniref:hypothetical protein n=1 Tax=uncultured Ruminococcus sp. TaxID=165186 RepID=UPI0025D9A4D7|nr:hypothetical protein [uncultured Ruminococcus sp.]
MGLFSKKEHSPVKDKYSAARDIAERSLAIVTEKGDADGLGGFGRRDGGDYYLYYYSAGNRIELPVIGDVSFDELRRFFAECGEPGGTRCFLHTVSGRRFAVVLEPQEFGFKGNIKFMYDDGE